MLVNDFEDFISDVVEFDIATVVRAGVEQLRSSLRPPYAEDNWQYLSTEWSNAFGPEWRQLANEAKAIRGHRGYRNAAADVTRAESWRLTCFGRLTEAISMRSRADIDRWRWSARAYRETIDGFLRDWRTQVENRERLPGLSALTDSRDAGEKRVLVAIARSYHDTAMHYTAVSPFVASVAIDQLEQVQLATFDADARYMTDVAQRDALSADAARLVGAMVQRVGRIPSVKGQIAAYRAGVAQARREEEHRSLRQAAETVDTSLADLMYRTASLASAARAVQEELNLMNKPQDVRTSEKKGMKRTAAKKRTRSKKQATDEASLRDTEGKKATRSADSPGRVYESPSLGEAHVLGRAMKLLETGLVESALEACETLVTLAGHSPLSLVRRALVKASLKETDDALADCRRAARESEGKMYELAIAAAVCIDCVPTELERAQQAIQLARSAAIADKMTLDLISGRYAQCQRRQRSGPNPSDASIVT